MFIPLNTIEERQDFHFAIQTLLANFAPIVFNAGVPFASRLPDQIIRRI